MKMKKLLAVVLTGVMAVSMLTGCADIKTRQIADQLEGMLKGINTSATVSATKNAEKLAETAAKAVKADNVIFDATAAIAETGANRSAPIMKTADQAIKEALKLDETKDKYVWVMYIATKNVKNIDQAYKIFNQVVYPTKAKNYGVVENIDVTTTDKNGKSDTKTYKPMTGDKYEIGTETFSRGEGKEKVDYVMVVVTCKAVASDQVVS